MCTYNASPEAEAGALSMPDQSGLRYERRMGFGIYNLVIDHSHVIGKPWVLFPAQKSRELIYMRNEARDFRELVYTLDSSLMSRKGNRKAGTCLRYCN